jgi:competence protein ComEA
LQAADPFEEPATATHTAAPQPARSNGVAAFVPPARATVPPQAVTTYVNGKAYAIVTVPPATREATAPPQAVFPGPLNSATLAQLETLSGIGPVKAQAILDYRAGAGGFSSVEQLLEVKGIGEKTLEKLLPYVTL